MIWYIMITIWYFQNLINETLSTPLSTLEAEKFVPAKHAEAEPKIRVYLKKKLYLQVAPIANLAYQSDEITRHRL